MGQRLILDVFEDVSTDEKPIANIYYHWSAYTLSAMEEAIQFLWKYETSLETDPDLTLRQRLYKIIDGNGGGFSKSHIQTELNTYPELKDVYIERDSWSRNQGLIAFSEDDQVDNNNWGEGFAVIDLKTRKINISPMFDIYDDDDFDNDIAQDTLAYAANDFDDIESPVETLDDWHEAIASLASIDAHSWSLLTKDWLTIDETLALGDTLDKTNAVFHPENDNSQFCEMIA